MGRYVVSAYYGHDSSVAVVGEGKIAHLEYERVTRRKHENSMSREAFDALFAEALALVGAHRDEVVAMVEVGCGDHLNSKRSRPYWARILSEWDEARTRFLGPELPCYYVAHHLAHAAYAFYTSTHEDAHVVAVDGGGDAWLPDGGSPRVVTAGIGSFEHRFGEKASKAVLYATDVASLIGGEWASLALTWCRDDYAAGTVMAMHGMPPGLFSLQTGLDVGCWSRLHRLQEQTTAAFHQLAPASLVRDHGGRVCMAGGVALNGIATFDLLERDDVLHVHVPPAVHDGGLTVGAALFGLHRILGEPRARYTTDQVAFAGHAEPDLHGHQVQEVVDRLAAGEVVALCSGRAESGPRALGHRSILADPRLPDVKDRLNQIKGRQRYRPVAPVVLAEHVGDFFEVKRPDCCRYMTVIARANERARREIRAGVHLDGSARLQVVERDQDLGRIVAAFHATTGCPAVLNTSFNLAGEAMVNDAPQAYDTFYRSGIDALVLGGHLVEQP